MQFSVRPWFIRRAARRTSLAAASRREVKNWLAAAPIFYFPQLLSLDELLDESESRELGASLRNMRRCFRASHQPVVRDVGEDGVAMLVHRKSAAACGQCALP